MEIILTQNVRELGTIGSVVTVKDGYAKNCLIPQNKAMPATKKNLEDLNSKLDEIKKNDAKRKVVAEKAQSILERIPLIVIRQASEDGKLYGSVTSKNVADGLNVLLGMNGLKNFTITSHEVVIAVPIKEIGLTVVSVDLHNDIVFKVEVNVARSESEAAETYKAARRNREKSTSDKNEGEGAYQH